MKAIAVFNWEDNNIPSKTYSLTDSMYGIKHNGQRPISVTLTALGNTSNLTVAEINAIKNEFYKRVITVIHPIKGKVHMDEDMKKIIAYSNILGYDEW